jgi:hypothetical protein
LRSFTPQQIEVATIVFCKTVRREYFRAFPHREHEQHLYPTWERMKPEEQLRMKRCVLSALLSVDPAFVERYLAATGPEQPPG